MPFIKILNDGYSTNSIEQIDFTPTPTGEKQVRIRLFGAKENEDFFYTDELAILAERVLVPAVVLRFGTDVVFARDIAWFVANQGSLTVRVVSDPPAITRTFTGDIANSIISQLGQAEVGSGIIAIGPDTHIVADIDWFNLEASFADGNTGVELRMKADPLDADGNQLTRKYTGQLASDAYDQLIQLTGTEDETIAQEIAATRGGN